MRRMYVWFVGANAVPASAGPPVIVAVPARPGHYKTLALVLLLVLCGISYSGYQGIRWLMKRSASTSVTTTVVTAPGTVADSIDSDIMSLDNSITRGSALMALAEKMDVVVPKLVEKGFASHDNELAKKCGREIYNIYGQEAALSVLWYTHETNEGRAVVRKWASLWFEHYCPGTMLGRLEKCESRPAKSVREAKQLAKLEAALKKVLTTFQTKQEANASDNLKAQLSAFKESSQAQKAWEEEIRAANALNSNLLKQVVEKAEALLKTQSVSVLMKTPTPKVQAPKVCTPTPARR